MALSEQLQYAGEYELEEIKLFSSTSMGVDIEGLLMELNLFEDIFSNSLSGNLFMIDTDNLIANMPIIGQETLSLKIKTPNFDDERTHFNFTKHRFEVYKVGISTEISHGSNIYELKFISSEILRNVRTRVSKSYTQPISEIVADLLTNEQYIGTTKELEIEPTLGVRRYVCPNSHPYAVIKSFLKESISGITQSPHYLFFENNRGIHFKTLQILYGEPDRGLHHSGDYIRTGIGTKIGASKNALLDLTRMLQYDIVTNNDMLLNITGGMLGSKNITHDIYNKNYAKDEFNYFEHFDKHDRISIEDTKAVDNFRYSTRPADYSGNDVGSFPDSDIHLIPTSTVSDKDAFHYDESYAYTPSQLRDTILPRKSRLTEFARGIQVNFEAHGHTALAAGDMVKLELPVAGIDHHDDKISKYYKGRFLITTLRHQFVNSTSPRHLMQISAFRDSLPESLPS